MNTGQTPPETKQPACLRVGEKLIDSAFTPSQRHCSRMQDPDDLSYLKFMGPAKRDKAIHTLQGIVKGMWIDGVFNTAEMIELKDWCNDHEHLINRAPFSDIIPKLLKAMEDGQIDAEEFADIEWVLKNSKVENEYFDTITSDIQELHGVVHGLTADGKIKESELRGLHEWILEREHLKGSYPYDEIESLIVGILRDGVIDAAEHAALMAFFNEFVSYSLSKRVKRAIEVARSSEIPNLSKMGICAIDPEITFAGKVFVFTGLSEKAARKEIAQRIAEKEGALSENLSTSHYLVVGNQGNPAWAFACYGRKVERAMQLRKQGRNLVIVNEVDFWDALS